MIPTIPTVPKEIKDAINIDKFAIFIGAGVSRLVGCLGWDELARNLVIRCHNSIKKNNERVISFREKETLQNNNDHKRIITICHHILKKANLEKIFFQEMRRALNFRKKIKSPNIYNDIKKLRGVSITTNADLHYDDQFNEFDIKYKSDDFDSENINIYHLYHIHGSIIDRHSLIFTSEKYLERYTDPNFRKFLTRIFDEYVILFIGYGLAEFELIEYLFQKNSKQMGNVARELRHFILLPYYTGEERILQFDESYYNIFGIRILAYSKDINGYNQLNDIIRYWAEDINKTSPYSGKSIRVLDNAIKKITK